MPAAPRPNPLPSADLEQLRTWRNLPERNLSLDTVFSSARKDLKKRARALGGIGAAWAALIPAQLLERATLVSLQRGILTVRCDDSATRFELDRFLRCGGELALIRKAPAGLTRVRLVA